MSFLVKTANFDTMDCEPLIVHAAKNTSQFPMHNKFSFMITSFPAAQINHKKFNQNCCHLLHGFV